jgi:predicted transposase YbfD/YdcC
MDDSAHLVIHHCFDALPDPRVERAKRHQLLALLDLRGAVVTLDATHTQTTTAQTIRSRGRDYVLALKANQLTTWVAVVTFFAEAMRESWRAEAHEQLVTKDAGHGRLEGRHYWTSTDAQLLTYLNPDGPTWPDLGCVGLVERARTTEAGTTWGNSTAEGQRHALGTDARRCAAGTAEVACSDRWDAAWPQMHHELCRLWLRCRSARCHPLSSLPRLDAAPPPRRDPSVAAAAHRAGMPHSAEP